MKHRVIVHPPAKEDLRRNAAWWAEHHSLEQAITWLIAIEKQLEALAAFPESHQLSAENEQFPFDIRDYLVGLGSRRTYRAVFTIQSDAVHVLTIRRGTQADLQPGDLKFE